MNAAWLRSSDTRFLLALHRAPGVGAATVQRLGEQFPALEDVFARDARGWLARNLPEATWRCLTEPPWVRVDADLEWLAQPGRALLARGDPAYPTRLHEIADPPCVLFVRGSPALLCSAQLAMVGSRNPTASGAQTAFSFARVLAACGIVVTSGLAVGVDAASHRGALDASAPTVAVMGSGPDQVYPRTHAALAEQIAACGALVTEYPTGSAPRAAHFPRRNRIISGLSLGVLVVEAALRSGSLITARQAMEQGREVFAIPGSIHSPLARGCHSLIREGAKLVETAQDIVEEILPQLRALPEAADAASTEGPRDELDSDYRVLVDAMGFDPVSVDVLVERTALTPQVVSSMLLRLELNGQVSSISGGLYTRTSRNRK